MIVGFGTRRFWIGSLPLALALVTLAGSSASRESSPNRSAPLDSARTKHLIVISVDGLRPDAIAKYHLATLERLAHEGAVSLEARTINPSITLPSHASMLTGVEPGVHGIDWNDDRHEDAAQLKVPSIFVLAHQAGLRTAAFFSKSKLRQLAAPGALDHEESPPGGYEVPGERTALDVSSYFATGARPNLLFIHLADADRAGHKNGWMSPAYREAAERVDVVIEEMLQAADSALGKGEYTVIVTADHGGSGRRHRVGDARNVTIPWIASGKGVLRDHQLPRGIRTTDTAATALWLLGVPIPKWMTGTPVTAAFAPIVEPVAPGASSASAARHPAGAGG